MAEQSPLRGIPSNISLVGTDDEIKTQLALLLGIGQLTEAQSKGFDIDFLKWVELFENGFNQGFAPRQNKKLNEYWGQTQKTRPRVRVLNESAKTWQQQGFYLVELQYDRTKEEESELLFGTPKELIAKIMDAMNFHLKMQNALNVDLDEVIAAIEREPVKFNPTGHPKVKLIFLENYVEWQKRLANDSSASRGKGQISFRLMNKINKNITFAELEVLANNIKAKFVKPVFRFTKGKEYYRYLEPAAGDPLKCWAKNEAEARKVYGQVLDLINQKPEKVKIRKGISLDPARAFPDKPGTEIILGKPIKLDKLRPVIDVEFVASYLMMEGLRKPIYLVNRRNRSKSLVSPD